MPSFQWTKVESEEFLSRIDRGLKELSFNFLIHDPEASCFVWSRPYVDGCNLELTLWPRREKGGEFSLGATLSITSERQGMLERQLRLGHSSEPVSIFSVPVVWLATYFGIVPDPSEALGVMTKLQASSLEESARVIVALLSSVSARFVSLFSTRMDVANLLVAIPSMACESMKGGGPVSSDPDMFAAVLAHDEGESAWALRLLRDRAAADADSSAMAVLNWIAMPRD